MKEMHLGRFYHNVPLSLFTALVYKNITLEIILTGTLFITKVLKINEQFYIHPAY